MEFRKCDLCENKYFANGLCQSHNNKKYHEEHKKNITARKRKNYLLNREKEILRTKLYKQKNKEKMNLYKREYESTHLDYRLWKYNYNKLYREENRDRVNARARIYNKHRRATDPSYKLSLNIRRRILSALKGESHKPTIKLLGISVKEYKKYLEAQFYTDNLTGKKMTWENWGRYGWHIDHIKALHTFDLSDPKQVIEAFYYKNTRPLWWKDNLRRNRKYD